MQIRSELEVVKLDCLEHIVNELEGIVVLELGTGTGPEGNIVIKCEDWNGFLIRVDYDCTAGGRVRVEPQAGHRYMLAANTLVSSHGHAEINQAYVIDCGTAEGSRQADIGHLSCADIGCREARQGRAIRIGLVVFVAKIVCEEAAQARLAVAAQAVFIVGKRYWERIYVGCPRGKIFQGGHCDRIPGALRNHSIGEDARCA